jgi:hypothetical protein
MNDLSACSLLVGLPDCITQAGAVGQAPEFLSEHSLQDQLFVCNFALRSFKTLIKKS